MLAAGDLNAGCVTYPLDQSSPYLPGKRSLLLTQMLIFVINSVRKVLAAAKV